MSSSRRALFALAISMAVPVCAAQAATFTVDRTDDADVSACSSAPNDCTLRGAMNKANVTAGADTIRFVLNTDSSIYLTQPSLPTINGELSIEGLGAGLLTIFAGQNGHLFTVPQGSKLNLASLNIGGGADTSDGNRGGIIDNAGTTTVKGCRVGGSLANGGAIYNSGSLTLNDTYIGDNGQFGTGGPAVRNTANLTVSNCSFHSNQSISRGAGIDNTGTANVVNSTFADNNANGNGGAIFNGGTLNVTNSTFSQNSVRAGFFGGAIYSGDGGLTLESCTLFINTAQQGYGGGLFCQSNGTVHNTIISGNRGDDVGTRSTGTTPFRSLGANLIGTGDGAARFNAAKDQVGITDPRLNSLQDYEGPGNGSGFFTETHALLPGSPAIDKGDTNLTVDQRNSPRPQGAADDIGAYEMRGSTPEISSLFVNKGGFTIDNTDGRTTLPEAILYANSKPGADVITFDPNLAVSASTDKSLPTITEDLVINGPTVYRIGYGGFNKARLFTIAKGVTATITDLIISGGSDSATDNRGGGILNLGDLTLRNVTLSGNAGGEGGGVANIGGSLTAINCLFANNIGRNSGGAILNQDGSVSLTNCTLTGNVAEGSVANASGGAAIDSFGSNAKVSLDSVTLANNRAPNVADNTRAGVWIEGGTLQLRNTILSGNGARDLQNDGGTITSLGNNIIGQTSTNAGLVASDKIGIDPKLGPLGTNGGPTQTLALLEGSPAINTGSTTLTTDQRGIARPQGGIADIGAYELISATPPPSETPSLIVTTNDDSVANDGQTSLREAMNYANSRAGDDTVTFANNVRGTITLKSRLPKVTDGLTINGPGAPVLAIDGGGKVKLFYIGSGVAADINYLTLSNGRYDANEGTEGALLNEGNLTLRQVAMTGNVGIEGGAVTNTKGSVAMFGCQISGNIALNGGGGLLNNDGTLIVFNSTVANNVVVGNVANASGGGGISTFGSRASTTLEYVTMTGNAAPNVAGNMRAGVWVEGGSFVPHNSIFSGNGARDLQIDGGFVRSNGYNIIGKTSSKTGFKGTDRYGINPQLGALTDNGGSTKTQALWPGSPAINTGDPAYGNGTDQRGGSFLRLRGGRIDVGAFEVQSDAGTTSRTSAPSAPGATSKAKAPSGGAS